MLSEPHASATTTPRWRTIVADPDPRARATLARVIAGAGGQVETETEDCRAAVALVERVRPDVAILGLQHAADLFTARIWLDTFPCAVVLLTGATDQALLERARTSGVMALLLKPLRAAQLPATLDLAVARFADVRRLRQALEDRKVIERATRRLMARHGLGEAEAYHGLRCRAMDARISLADAARAVLAAATAVDGGPPAPPRFRYSCALARPGDPMRRRPAVQRPPD
jgi:response regulator NasT